MKPGEMVLRAALSAADIVRSVDPPEVRALDYALVLAALVGQHDEVRIGRAAFHTIGSRDEMHASWDPGRDELVLRLVRR